MSKARLGSAGIAVIAANCAVLLSACAAPHSYMGISFDSPAVDGNIKALARKAQSGDKQAQLELGVAFEEGRGAPSNRAMARRLYQLAAAVSGGQMWVYYPQVRGGEAGRVVPVDKGRIVPGLPEARKRLEALSD